MTLGFLTPRGPAARSPLHHVLEALGATFEERAGWLVPTRIAAPDLESSAVRETVAWADVSHLPKADPAGVDVTTQFGALLVAGPLARETIARFCALDLRPHVAPPGAALPGSVARTPGAVFVESGDRFRLQFGAATAEYVWRVVSDAGAQQGGRPVGADAVAEVAADA